MSIDCIAETHHVYNNLDRAVRVEEADGTERRFSYRAAWRDGAERLLDVAADGNGHRTAVYRDVRGLPTETVDALGHSTRYEYDAVGQLLRTVDAEVHEVKHDYDLAGRRTGRSHPAAGETSWRYDPAGNVTLQAAAGDTVRYAYHYGRLTAVINTVVMLNRCKLEGFSVIYNVGRT